MDQLVIGAVNWIPTILGVGLRTLVCRLIMKLQGVPATKDEVRLVYVSHIR